MKIHPCPKCGHNLTIVRQGNSLRISSALVSCRECKKLFQPRRSTAEFCSVQCKRIARNRRNRTWKTVPDNCRQCGEGFERRYSWQRYCSRNCNLIALKKKSKRNYPIRYCEGCNKRFIPTHAQQRFCDANCRERTRMRNKRTKGK